jgi:hypothetical protein
VIKIIVAQFLTSNVVGESKLAGSQENCSGYKLSDDTLCRAIAALEEFLRQRRQPAT